MMPGNAPVPSSFASTSARPPLQERANAGLHLHVAHAIETLRLARSAAILDMGCGSGAFLHRLRENGYSDLCGVDIEPPPASDGIRYSALDLDSGRIAHADASFDLIVAIEVFEHVENLGRAVSEAARILKPEGRLIVTTPNVHSLEARLRMLLTGKLKQFDDIGDPTHITPLFIHPFSTLLTRHSLRIGEAWGFPERGGSPTSRAGLRVLAGFAYAIGMRGQPPGDNLCMFIERVNITPNGATKLEAVTSHYRDTP